MIDLMKKKRKGYILMNSVLAIIVLMMVSNGLFTIFSSQFSMAQSGRIALQSQQYAEVAANTLRLHNYDQLDIVAHGRKIIENTDGTWEDEISIGAEKIIDDSTQRIATVKIYKTGDTLARCSLQVPLSSQQSINNNNNKSYTIIAAGRIETPSRGGIYIPVPEGVNRSECLFLALLPKSVLERQDRFSIDINTGYLVANYEHSWGGESDHSEQVGTMVDYLVIKK